MSVKFRLIVMNFLQYGVWGAWLISLGAYLGGGLHYSGVEIGSFFATMGIASLFMPALMGIIADRWVPAQKLLGQLLVTGVFALYLVRSPETDMAMKIPFLPGRTLDFGVWNLPILFFVVIGTVNGTNFTDGLDGLAGSVTALVAVFFSAVAIGTKSGIEPVTCAVAGGLMGFLLFNVHPASVFMGDTGSLALGGFVAGAAYLMQLPLFIPIVGFVYLAEVLSVILQVSWYKISGGRRIFKMAPLHHHFELCGWSETRVVAVFSIVTALLCLMALAGI